VVSDSAQNNEENGESGKRKKTRSSLISIRCSRSPGVSGLALRRCRILVRLLVHGLLLSRLHKHALRYLLLLLVHLRGHRLLLLLRAELSADAHSKARPRHALRGELLLRLTAHVRRMVV